MTREKKKQPPPPPPPLSRLALAAVSLFVSRSTLCSPLIGAFVLFKSDLQGLTCYNSAPEPCGSLGLTHYLCEVPAGVVSFF